MGSPLQSVQHIEQAGGVWRIRKRDRQSTKGFKDEDMIGSSGIDEEATKSLH